MIRLDPANEHGWGRQRCNPTKPHEPGSVHGHLTAERQSTVDKRYTFYRCACGSEVRRKHSDVDKATRAGSVQACSRMCPARKR
jgi:hypothetical protein